MTGYLQRLASAAMRPARAIHPVVGSVYAPAAQPAAMDSGEDFSVEAMTREPGPAASYEVARLDAPLVSPAGTQSEQDRFSARMQAGSRLTSSTDPAAPAPSNFASAGAGSSAGPEAPNIDRREPQSAEMRRTASTESTTDADEFHPLVRVAPPVWQATPAPESPLVREVRNSAASQNSRSVGNPRQTAPVPAQREPDEIQIHIGRIEVTAVPPPAAQRPAPREQHKSLSLDDYLKRRNGRNG